MSENSNEDFCWNDLLARIARKNVIPVIGEGLYWVREKSDKSNGQTGDFLLYPYLADKFPAQMGIAPAENKETFFQAVFRYMGKKPNEYLAVNDFMCRELDPLFPVTGGPLWKLAQIKGLGLFINTTHDDYLEKILKRVRKHPVETIHYTIEEKWSGAPDAAIFKKLNAGECSLVFNIYGSAAHSMTPAYTEKDILETIVMFQKDMETDRLNPFFQALERSSLLFMGCRYDDWLFRFFIRTMSNKPYSTLKRSAGRQFIGDDFGEFNCGGLKEFLTSHAAGVFYSPRNVEFVDRLHGEMKEKFPGNIINAEDYPGIAFLSFHGKDRDAAAGLAERLREDGIEVWLDQWDLSAGDIVDETISNAISARPVFIPIVSDAARQFLTENGTAVKYHIREWEWAYGQKIKGRDPAHIIPVVIDDTGWMYESFKKYTYLKIPGGGRTGDYEKLRDRLREILTHGAG